MKRPCIDCASVWLNICVHDLYEGYYYIVELPICSHVSETIFHLYDHEMKYNWLTTYFMLFSLWLNIAFFFLSWYLNWRRCLLVDCTNCVNEGQRYTLILIQSGSLCPTFTMQFKSLPFVVVNCATVTTGDNILFLCSCFFLPTIVYCCGLI